MPSLVSPPLLAVGSSCCLVHADAWLASPQQPEKSAQGAFVRQACPGAEVAGAAVVDLDTARGSRVVRIEPGAGALVASGPSGTEPGRQRLADLLPGVWRGSTSGWLAGMGQLDDPGAASRFIASRLVYRQLGRRAWLLALPVLVALLARLPVAFLRPARHLAGPLLLTALAAAVIEVILLVALAAVSLRQVWLAFSGKGGEPLDLNESARAAARARVGEGLAGLVTGCTRRAELTRVGAGFYANAGSCGDIVSEYAPRFGGLGLPSPFLAARQVSWVELEAGNELHARLLYGHVLLPGSTWAERKLARVPRRRPQRPSQARGRRPPGVRSSLVSRRRRPVTASRRVTRRR